MRHFLQLVLFAVFNLMLIFCCLQYCAMGLGLVGLDFRGLLPPLFEG